MRESVSDESRVIALANETLQLTLLSLSDGSSLTLFFNTVMDLVIIEYRRVHVIFIIYLLSAEYGLLVRNPEDLPVAPLVH